jgi:hypothetical protein
MKNLLVIMGILIVIIYGGYYLTQYDAPTVPTTVSEE